MSWKCPDCGIASLEDNSMKCEVCGYTRTSHLVLTSNGNQTWKTLIEAEVTRRTYKRLYPGEEHQYVPRNEGEYPFIVKRDSNNLWILKTNQNCAIGVTINGVFCSSSTEFPLNDGDTICLASRSDTTRQIAPLKVSFVVVEENV